MAEVTNGAYAVVFVTVIKEKGGAEKLHTIIETSHPGIRTFFGQPGGLMNHRLAALFHTALADNDDADE